MAGYIGSKASVVSSGAERKKVFAITTTTTSLTGLSYTIDQVHVYHNGIRLVDGTDYTATNGTSITLNSAAESGDEVVVVSYATFQVADTVSASAGGTFAKPVTIDGNSASALTVDRATTDGAIIDVQKNGSTVGRIGVGNTDNLTVSGNSTHSGLMFGTNNVLPYKNGAISSATEDLGSIWYKWRDAYLSGGVYLGGTGAANKLDDYEEGTWTPNIIRNDGTVAASFIFTNATYVKMGRLVTIKAYINSVSAGSSDGSSYWTIYGVPFLGAQYSGAAMAYNSTQANNLYIGDAGGNIIFTNNNIIYSGALSGTFMLNLTYETNS